MTKPALKLHVPPPRKKRHRMFPTEPTPCHLPFLHLFDRAGGKGLTDAEVILKLGVTKGNANGRRLELVRMGYLKDSGGTRQTARNKQAVVWVRTTKPLLKKK